MKPNAGSSGSAALPSIPKNVFFEEDDDKSSARTRRRRSSNNFKALEWLNNKFPPNESIATGDPKLGSPSGPAAYLNSVRSTLSFDNSSSPAQDRPTAIGNNGQNTNGVFSGYKLPQKRRNRLQETGNHHKPAEVFRKDLISAMKIPDTSQLLSEEYWVMRDSWRMEWEKGVQVPVNPNALPAVKIDTVPKDTKGDFRMPRKLIKTMPDVGDRDTVNLNVLADSTCRYDLDEVDVAWLGVINEERAWMGYSELDEFTMEIIMEELETQCHENMQLAIKTKKGLGIEYDENIVCDVCRSPDCEEGNEMVFCDGCNLCVHQACYGILKVPDGSWLCKPCALGIRGSALCILCGRKGGAMKSTKSGRKWAHMSCALWIPEITIADPERMEPITKISHIPSSRWSLLCSVCKERSIGACIQCSVRHCVTAYHVTCAMESGFDMITDCPSPNSSLTAGESAVVFRSYCRKHSKNYKKKIENSPCKKTEEEKRSDRQKRIAELEEDFCSLVKNEGVASALNIPIETVAQVMEFWKLKRKANFSHPLVTPKQEEGKALEEAAETGLQRRLRMFTHLRQDLERVRNLCYMIGRREKMKRSSVKVMSSVFLAQIHYLEYKMSHSSSFQPRTLISNLPRFGKPEILDEARRESLELAQTKEWSQGSSPAQCDDTTVAYEKDKILNKEEKILLPQPRTNVDVKANIKEKAPVERSRKNGLVATAVRSHRRKSFTVTTKNETLAPRRRLSEGAFTNASIEECNKTETKNRNMKTSKGLPHSTRKRDLNSELSNTESSDATNSDLREKRNFKHLGSNLVSKKVSDKKSVSHESQYDTVKRTDPIKKSQMHKRRLRHTTQEFIDTSERSSNSFKNFTVSKTRIERGGRLRRSSRHLDFSNSDDSDARRHHHHQAKMTVSTETISETNYFGNKWCEEDSRKRSWSLFRGVTSPGSKAKRTKLESVRSAKEPGHQVQTSSESKRLESSAEEDVSKSRVNANREISSPSQSRNCKNLSPTSPMPHSKKPQVKRPVAKNGQGALALSHGRSNSVAHDKTDNSDAGLGPERRLLGQELIHRNTISPPKPFENPSHLPRTKRAQRISISPKSKAKSTSIIEEKSKIDWRTTELDINYASNCSVPLKRYDWVPSPPVSSTKPSGLKWVPLGDDIADDITSYPPCAVTPKDQEGYRGDMDESDSESQNSLHLHRHHHRRHSSRKRVSLNPGKNRTGIGVLQCKVSDSSGDDFDIPFVSLPTGASERMQQKPKRQKLRSINNTGEAADHSVSLMTPTEKSNSMRKKTQETPSSIVETVKPTVSKNVQAVGGIQGALKSERDIDIPPFLSRTTDGKGSQDNFFDKFSFLNSCDSEPFSHAGGNTNRSFLQNQFVPPEMLDMPFRSRTLFPYGAVNPWQGSHLSSLPSIVPNRYPMPVFYQYPPFSHPVNDFQKKSEVRPSPPPMPDSTLSPESFVPTSASVAVQASPCHSTTPSLKNDFNPASQRYTSPLNQRMADDDADNEWEIVHEGGGFDRNSNGVTHQRRKHKKKKKKKKRRRMLFPDGYDSDKWGSSSQATCLAEPTYGAIVPRGLSTHYQAVDDSPEMSENASSHFESDLDRKSADCSRKLVLKINKKDLTVAPPDLSTADLVRNKVSGEGFKLSSPSKTENAGLKLTFKKSQYYPEHIIKKHKRRRKLHRSASSYLTMYTVSPVKESGLSVGLEAGKKPCKPALLRRLGLDIKNLPIGEADDGIGRRALRERKPTLKSPEKTMRDSNAEMEQKGQRIRHRNPTGLKDITSPPKLRMRKSTQNLPQMSHPSSHSDPTKIKRGRGRPRKIRALGDTIPQVPKVQQEDLKTNEQFKHCEQKDLAKFAGWSTKSLKAVTSSSASSTVVSSGSSLQLLPKTVSAGSSRCRVDSIPSRSFSTDSDQNYAVNTVSLDHQPPRHWKKQKVREHEFQISEHPEIPSRPHDTSLGAANDRVLGTSTSSPLVLNRPSRTPPSKSQNVFGFGKVKSEKDSALSNPKRLKHHESVLEETEAAQTPKTFPAVFTDTGNISSLHKFEKTIDPSISFPECDLSNYTASSNAVDAVISTGLSEPISGSLGSGATTSPSLKFEESHSKAGRLYQADFNLGFAMQTDRFANYKIPKKMHQTHKDPYLPQTGP